MGRVRRSRTHSSAKNQAKTQKTKRYKRDLDQIQADMKDPKRREKIEGPWLPDSEDLPGGGDFPCVECDRHFPCERDRQAHVKSKQHRRRLKELSEPAFTIAEAERAAGRGVDNRQRNPDGSIRPQNDLVMQT